MISTDFSDLSQDDQLILIKTGFFEIWLTRMARMFSRSDNMVMFEDGSLISRDEISVVYTVKKIFFTLFSNQNQFENLLIKKNRTSSRFQCVKINCFVFMSTLLI